MLDCGFQGDAEVLRAVLAEKFAVRRRRINCLRQAAAQCLEDGARSPAGPCEVVGSRWARASGPLEPYVPSDFARCSGDQWTEI